MRIAYLAPEIPARSATFVYQEIHELEKHGYSVLPYSLRLPNDPASDQEKLQSQTSYLNQDRYFTVIGRALKSYFNPKIKMKCAWSALMADLRYVNDWKTRLKLCYQFLAALYLGDSLLKNGVNHLHVHFAHVPTQVAMYASLLTNIPFTVTSHANDIFERGLLLCQKAERSQGFFTISNYNLKFLQAQSVPESKLGLVRCGVSLQYKKQLPRIAEQKKSIVIGTLGRLVEKKGIDVLICAFDNLQKICPDLQVALRVAGDGPLLENLNELVKEKELESSVFFDGALPHSEVSEWLQQLDLFVLACKVDTNGDMDGIPVVLMEAMSQSVPVVTTRLSGMPELVMPDVTGFLAEPGSIQSMTNVLVEVIEKRKDLQFLTDNALNHVMKEFSLESNVKRLMDVFKSSLDSGVK